MSKLRFKVGDLARVVRCNRPCPENGWAPGAIVEVVGYGARCRGKLRDYRTTTPNPNAHYGAVDDNQLAPYPDPSDWDSFERETGLPRLTGKVKEEV